MSPLDNDLPTLTKGKDSWDVLRKKTLACTKCSLRESCQQVIFGSGNINAPLFMVGEGPGAQEDKLGVPFVGKAGQLLDKILAAINLKRADVYISNVVKCRPPNNRKPSTAEIENCKQWLEKEIEIIKPQIILLLGATALQAMIDPRGLITKMRGQWIKQNGHVYMATFHPAALLRDPRKKLPVWEDFQKIEAVLKKTK